MAELIDSMLEKAEEAPALFVRFENKAAQYGKEIVYCFVEDFDMAFYSGIIDHVLGKRWDSIRCKGKENLLGIYHYLKDMEAYKDYAKRFFIDADFDENEGLDDDIYITPCYAIENLFLEDSCVEAILKTEYDIDSVENKDKLDKCMDLYHLRLSQMHEAECDFNAWYAALYQTEGWNRRGVHLGSRFPKEFIKYKMDEEIVPMYTIANIQTRFPAAPIVDENLIRTKKEWLKENPLARHRGKYEMEFLAKFLLYLNDDAAGQQNYTTKKAVPIVALDRMVSLYCQYVVIPDNLKDYIRTGKYVA